MPLQRPFVPRSSELLDMQRLLLSVGASFTQRTRFGGVMSLLAILESEVTSDFTATERLTFKFALSTSSAGSIDVLSLRAIFLGGSKTSLSWHLPVR
jgi:hypothetical protein